MSDEKAETVAPPPETVPAARLAEVVAERNAARRELADAVTRGAKAGEWEAAATQHAAELVAERAARSEERDLYRAGLLDEEAHVVARALYAAHPAEGKPGTLGEYLTGLRAEGATVPRALSGYLGEPGKAAPAPPVVQPRAPAGGGKAAPNGVTVTAEALVAAREHYRRTGDMSQMQSLAAARKAQA